MLTPAAGRVSLIMLVRVEAASMKDYFVYILASRRNGTLYIGVTNDLPRRILEHKQGLIKGFTAKYGVNRLVWFEHHLDIREAIARETSLKRWYRAWKLQLIERDNPTWRDLSDDFDAW